MMVQVDKRNVSKQDFSVFFDFVESIHTVLGHSRNRHRLGEQCGLVVSVLGM